MMVMVLYKRLYLVMHYVLCIRKNLGTVNYATGEIILKDLRIRSFEGAAIQITVKTKTRDFTSPKDRIFRIRQSDTTVTTRAV